MAYTIVQDFAGGLDHRKSALSTKPGALRKLTNAFVNAGGEVEKRKAFTYLSSLPDNTIGLAEHPVTLDAVVFGGDVAPSSALPAGVVYQQLAYGVQPAYILDWAPFGAQLYVVAEMADGSVQHFLNGVHVPDGLGKICVGHKTKMYGVDGSDVKFSAVNDAADYIGVGSGVIDITSYDAGTTQLIGAVPYYNWLALLGRSAVHIWFMDPDPDLNEQVQVLQSIGLLAPKARARYSNGDVLLLSHTGIRSLRARDSSNAAVLNDIGAPVDKLVEVRRQAMNNATKRRIAGTVDPQSGHFWLVWNEEIFVLSLYPQSKVSAWSLYEMGFVADYVAEVNSRMVLRSGDNLYLHGGVLDPNDPFGDASPSAGTDVYDESVVTVELPMLDMEMAATEKTWKGMDVNCQGTWKVYVNPEPKKAEDEAAWMLVNTVVGPTFGENGAIPLDISSTHLGVRLVNEDAGPASISGVGLHYTPGIDD